MSPSPQDFVDRAQYRAGGPYDIEAELDGVVYDVAPYGDDAVQVLTKDGTPVATLAFVDGQFVVPGS